MSRSTLGLQGLAGMAKVLTRQRSLTDLLETAAENACSALLAATVSISRLDADSELVSTIINVGDLGPGEERWPDDETFPAAGDGRLTSAVLDWRSWTGSLADPGCDPQEREALVRLGKGSSLATPILIDGQVWGEFYATRHVGAPMFDADAIAYAEVLVAILAAAVSTSLRESALQDLAFHDPLTGLLNRRGLDQAVAQLFDLGAHPSREVAIAVLDIDGLKQVNDTEGHLQGDEQICHVALALRSALDELPSAVVARVGGDEFTAIAACQDVELLEPLVNQVCREVAARDSTIGVSAGIAITVITPGLPMTASALFAAADRALYIAKRTRSHVAIIADGANV